MSALAEPLFTVIIPTKNRAVYLEKTLLTCTLQTYANLEVIVSDDGSEDGTKDVVARAAARDPRIRYVSPGAPVGMRENFEFALNHVRPGYVMALGSDDGLLPYAFEGMLEVLRSTGQELLTWSTPIFNYAGVRNDSSQLIIPTGSGVRLVRSAEVLARQSKNLSYVTDVELPMMYVKGVAATHLVERVRSRSKDNRFYVCSTPDGYSGIVLAGEVQSYAFSGTPFSLYGASPSSQGVAYMSGTVSAKKQSAQFFKDAEQVPMHEELASQPYSPLISVMTIDFLLHARDLPGWCGQVRPIDYRLLLQRGVQELSHGLYSQDRVGRELSILLRIAERHGLDREFKTLVAGTQRYIQKSPYPGSGVRPGQLFFNGPSFGLRDIVDAAYFVAAYKGVRASMGLLPALSAIYRSVAYRLLSQRRGSAFPTEEHWATNVQ
jgi:hypothetical protein